MDALEKVTRHVAERIVKDLNEACKEYSQALLKANDARRSGGTTLDERAYLIRSAQDDAHHYGGKSAALHSLLVALEIPYRKQEYLVTEYRLLDVKEEGEQE